MQGRICFTGRIYRNCVRNFDHFYHNNASEKGEKNNFGKITENPYFDKYSEKLKALQQKSAEEFQARLDKCHNVKNSQGDQCDDRSFGVADTGKPYSNYNFKRERKLDDIMKVDLLVDKSAQEISAIWVNFHNKPNKIAGAIPGETYDVMYRNSKQFPVVYTALQKKEKFIIVHSVDRVMKHVSTFMGIKNTHERIESILTLINRLQGTMEATAHFYHEFLYPLPRFKGYEFVVSEFSGHQCHLTSLTNYQAHRETAPELLNMTHFIDLKAGTGIVLMNGEFDSKLQTAEEARFLALLVQLYYSSKPDSIKYKILDAFTKNPNDFKYTDLIADLENIPI